MHRKLSYRTMALVSLAAACILGLATRQALAAPLNSNTTAIVNLSGTILSSLTVSTGNPTLTFSMVPGTTTNIVTTAPITTTWVLLSTNTMVKLYGYFASSTSALANGGLNPIPSADVLGSVTSSGGAASAPTTTLTAFSQTGPTGFGVAGSALLLDTYTISAANFVNLTGVTDTLSLSVATPANTPAGTYTGTITIEAQAN